VVARIWEHDADIGQRRLNQDGCNITCGERRLRCDEIVDLNNTRRG